MLSYTEHDNAQAVEIHVCGKVSTEEFDRLAQKLEAFIARHGQVRVLEQISEFEGMEAAALWHDLKFSLRHLKDFSRIAIVSEQSMVQFRLAVHRLRGGAFRTRSNRRGSRLADVAGRRR